MERTHKQIVKGNNKERKRDMEIKRIVHPGHPLTLRVNDGQLVCHGCAGSVFGEPYSCSNRGFHQEKCFICEETVSIGNSFYICAACWPKSPIFHQSCIDDIQEEIRLRYRPHCLPHFVGQSKDRSCDFCLRKHGRYKYRCEDCDFQIDTRCASKHIKYHEGQQLGYHFSHGHPLILLKFGDVNCKLCYEKIYGEGYGCAPCEFYIHDSCRDDGLTGEKRNHLHPQHSLKLKDYIVKIYRCTACCFYMQGLGYQCDTCAFHLHLECTSLKPTIKYKGHQHLLILVKNLSYKSRCKACGFDIQGVHFLRCVECSQNFHEQCNFEGGVWHFSHEHILMSHHKRGDHNKGKFCDGCGEAVRGATYGCEPCKFYLHEFCFKLPRKIYDHLSHEHYLSLQMSDTSNYSHTCNKCHEALSGFIYGCDTCHFELDLHCASEHPSVNLNISRKKIAHFSHRHYLDFFVVADGNCQLCFKNINGECCGCSDCAFYIHNSCGELQQEIGHPFHPSHSLILMVDERPRRCDGCLFDIKGMTYQCGIGMFDFNLHPECRSLKPDIEYEGHHHLLTLVKNSIFQWQCEACGLTTKGTFFLRCVECDLNFHEQCGPISFPIKSGDLLPRVAAKDVGSTCKSGEINIHKSCFKGPTEIHHPFHRHPLQLSNPFTEKYDTCSGCRKYYCSIRYHCKNCPFNLDLDCHPLFPSLKIDSIDHDDKLTLFKKMYGKPKCEFCNDSPRDDDLTPLDAFYFRCVKCDLNWHFLCCRLPQTIEHESHHHSLTLRDNFVDIFDGFDDEEFCCDLCEIRRNAREPVYHCKECNFIVDIKCVFSEVMQFLEGNHNSDEGRIVSREITRNFRGLTYKHIVKSLTEEERMSMEPFMERVKKIDYYTLQSEFQVFFQIDFSLYKYLREHDDFFKSMERKVQQLESIKEELVDVGGYKICKKLAEVLKDLLRDYGDIGAGCSFKKCVMTIPLTTLCVIIQEMSVTRMIDIDVDSIIFWWYHLKLVEEARFKIDFALNHLKRIFRFWFQIDTVERIKGSGFYEIHKGIADHYERIEKESEEIESLKEKAQGLVSSHASGEEMKRGQNLNEALGFLWKPVTLESLDRIPEF